MTTPEKELPLPTGSIKGVQAEPKVSCKRRDHLVELSVVSIHARYHQHARAALLLRQVPGFAGADFDARGGVDRDNGKFNDRKGAVHLAHEVRRAGGVNDMDVSAFPRAVQYGGMNGFLAIFLVYVEVACSRSVAYPAKTINLPAFQKHRFAQHGFSVA